MTTIPADQRFFIVNALGTHSCWSQAGFHTNVIRQHVHTILE
jgi:hypothetical protein